MQYDVNNIFYKIIHKQIAADIIYENDSAIVIADIEPKKKYHYLIIPKGNYINYHGFIATSSTKEKEDFFAAINEMVTKLKLDESGYRLICNSGDNGGQEVPHLHFHLLGGENVGSMVS